MQQNFVARKTSINPYADEFVQESSEAMEQYGIQAESSQQIKNAKYCELIQTGTEEEVKWAQERLYEENARLIYAFTSRCILFTSPSFDFEDAYQEACMAMGRAAKTYDPDKGAFSTYLYAWVRQYISRSNWEDGKDIRIPVHMLDKINGLKKRYGLSSIHDDTMLEMIHQDTSLSKLEKKNFIHAIQLFTINSLDSRIGGEDEENSTVGEMTRSNTNVEEDALEHIMNDEIRGMLDKLSSREKEIITKRFGLAGGKMATLEELGKEIGITRERVRQIEASALRKLRYIASQMEYTDPATGNPYKVSYAITYNPTKDKGTKRKCKRQKKRKGK